MDRPQATIVPSSSPPSFEKILNFRDLSNSIPVIKSDLFFRAARPDASTSSDRHLLTQVYKIRTVIDLRTPTEHLEARRRFTATPTPLAPTVTPEDPKFPMRIPGLRYEDVNFNGSSYSNALIKQLPWYQTVKLFGLYAAGYRTQAISVLGENVMARRGLAGLAEDSLEHCTKEVRSVFAVLADPAAYPVLVHCTQGKDRTGLIVLLVLMLLGVTRQAIERDYRLSEKELLSERAEKLREIRSIGLPDEFADCPEGWVGKVCGWIDERFGGVEAYLEHCGVGAAMRDRVKKILMKVEG